MPGDVSEQTWKDWLQLRKTKKAPVTQTVLNGAISEAQKAGIPLEDFLQIWCRRGSIGLEASWLTNKDMQTRTSSGKHTGFDTPDRYKGLQDVIPD